MKVLRDWRRLLKSYHKISLICLGLGSSLFASEESILSDSKNQILNYSYEKAIEDSKKLNKDWINPITYKYIYNNGEDYDTHKSQVNVSQPIFKSGGIYSAIKYAGSMGDYSKTSVDAQKKELIKQTLDILFEIKKTDITIEKQKLLVKNGEIDIQRKKEQVLNGILDTSFLDNAILDTNTQKNTLIDLQYQKQMLLNNLSNFTDSTYEELELPTFELTPNKEFMENNIYIKQQNEDIQNSYWMSRMVTSQYLPSVNFTADYTKYHDIDNSPTLTEDGTTNVGFNLTIPLDVRYSNDIQSSKIEYLQKKINLDEKIKEENNIYKNSVAKVESLDKKILIAKKDVELYDSLLTQLQEQLAVGMKTPSDVETMENSRKIKALDVKSLNIEKQMELLNIYSRVING